MDVHSIESTHAIFPELLRSSLIKPPITKLWYRGEWRAEQFAKCAAVVGSRRMSRYGRQAVEEVVSRLVGAGYTIVSGLMYGVDQLAHKVCLERGGTAIGVLGYGITNNNSDEATSLIEKIVAASGIVLSEYRGNQVSQQWMFPQRNRIVVGLSEVVVVVEAGLKSGSLNTAHWATRLGRKVYAVPGPIFSATSEGTNWLIRHSKATMLNLDELTTLTGTAPRRDNKTILSTLNAGQREIYALMKIEGPQTANEIGRSLSLSANEVMAHLVQMEIEGVVTQDRGIWVTI